MKRWIVKYILIFVVVVMALSLFGCNYQTVDLTYKFDYAYITYGDGVVKKVEIKSWRDYEDGDQIQITDTDGNVYLVHAESCVLVKEGG